MPERPEAVPVTHLPAGRDFLLLSPTVQAFAYRNVDRMFATRTIARGDRRPAAPGLPRGPAIDPRYVALSGDGRPQEQGVDGYIERTNVAGLLVLKAGRIVLERYALGLEEATRWSTMSMVKSMTSTLVGAALHDGAIRTIEDDIGTYLPALRGSAYDGVSVRHLLTMSSGVRWDESYTDRHSDVNRYSASLGDQVPGGVLALMRTLPRVAAPGTRFNYNTGDSYVVGCLVAAATGRTLAEYMSARIWGPAGMADEAFYTLESAGGQEIGGSRAGVSLRDLARFGRFVQEGGRAAGERILPDGWVASAARPAFALDPAANSYGAVGYGYGWWIDADGAMVAVGFAGQSLYINRLADVVIATLSCWPQPPFDAPYAIDRRAERLAFKAAVLACVG